MKRAIVIAAIVLIVCVMSTVALSACDAIGFPVELSVTGKNDSIVLLESFFKGTLAKANTVVTVKSGDKVEYTESIDGAKNCVLFASDNSKTYSFIQDDEYITAFPAGTGNYYLTGKNWYDKYYCYFSDFIDTMMLIPEEDGTFACASQTIDAGDKLDQSNALLTFEYASEDRSVKITAKNKNSLTQNVVIESYDQTNGSSTTTMTFAYDTASVIIPDISDWAPYEEETEEPEKQELNKTSYGAAALSTLNLFMYDSLSAPNLVAIVKVNNQEVLKEALSSCDAPRNETVFYTDYVLKDILRCDESEYFCQIEDITDIKNDKPVDKTELIFKCDNEEENVVLVATAENGLVRKITVARGQRTASSVTTIFIKY